MRCEPGSLYFWLLFLAIGAGQPVATVLPRHDFLVD